MRVAVVGTRGIPGVHGGVERHCEILYPRLAGLGVDVTVYARRPYVPEDTSYRGVRVVAMHGSTRRGVEAFTHTAAAIGAAAADGCDLLHVHSVGPCSLIPYARMRGHRRIVATIHAPDYLQEKWGAPARALLRYGERQAMRRAGAVISVSEWMADDLEQRYGVRPDHIPNGPGLLDAVPDAGRGVFQRIGVASGDYVLFVGRLIPDKRVEDLLDAAARTGSRVVVAGDTSDTDGYAQSLMARSGADARFPGYVYGDELAALYDGAAVLALPSAIEGLSVTLLEAMSRHVPIVASDIPANREVLAHGEAGELVPVGNVDDLAEALVRALQRGPDVERQVAAAAERAAAVYDWDVIAQRTKQIYDAVLAGRT